MLMSCIDQKIFSYFRIKLMKQAAAIFILIYYLFGNLCLPMADFSVLPDLPQMYRHCKATEDKDMNAVDFITDHLINIDGAFDRHENGDDQKPHSPFQFHNTLQQVLFTTFQLNVNFVNSNSDEEHITNRLECIYHSDYFEQVFRPPIV